MTNGNILWGCIVAEELYFAGVRLVCISPGSRSTPLVWGLVKLRQIKPDFQLLAHLDERSSAFFALGHAKRVGVPSALVCTSGTAVAHYFPAVIEANLMAVPLLILSADRPPHLRDCGAPQTIDQIKLFSNHVRYFCDVGLPNTNSQNLRGLRANLRRAIACARGDFTGTRGVVHLNFPFDEPLIDQPDFNYQFPLQNPIPFSPPTHPRSELSPQILSEIIYKIQHSERGIIILGLGDFGDQLIEIIGKISDRTGYPVLVEAIALQRSQFISHYDSFLRSKQFCASHVPDLVIRLGGMPTSKYLSQWLAQHIDCYAEITINFSYSNPLHSNSYNISCDPQQFLTALHNSLQEQQFSIDNRIDNQWRKSFASAQQTTKIVHDRFMENVPFPFEGKVYQLLAEHLPDHSYLYVANSMATRDLDTFFHNDRPIKILVNKGTNGIDGTISSALGCAYSNNQPTTLVCGDIAFFHDINSLLIPKKYPINLTILLLNNDGGAIFNYLKIAEYNPPFQEFFITSHNLDFEKIVTGFGGRYELISDWQKLQQEIKAIPHYRGLKVLEIKIDQQKSYALHQELWQNVTQVL